MCFIGGMHNLMCESVCRAVFFNVSWSVIEYTVNIDCLIQSAYGFLLNANVIYFTVCLFYKIFLKAKLDRYKPLTRGCNTKMYLMRLHFYKPGNNFCIWKIFRHWMCTCHLTSIYQQLGVTHKRIHSFLVYVDPLVLSPTCSFLFLHLSHPLVDV